jgi:hypothetical protein
MMVIGWWIGKDLEDSGRGLILSYYLPGGTEKNYENLRQDSRSPGRDLNPWPSEYEAGLLTTRPRLPSSVPMWQPLISIYF